MRSTVYTSKDPVYPTPEQLDEMTDYYEKKGFPAALKDGNTQKQKEKK